MNLPQAQKDATHHSDSNLHLIASAACRKTDVVARRFAKFLTTGVKAGNIITFPFLDKVATELKERIISRRRKAIGEIHGMSEISIGHVSPCQTLLFFPVRRPS
jgi:superfamily I DNA/RNA helicase